jgi:hypothetical protein
MMVTCHSNRLESSMRPAEKPSTGCFIRSARAQWLGVSGQVAPGRQASPDPRAHLAAAS